MGLLDDPNQLAAIVGLLQGRQPAGGLLMQYADSIEQRKRAAQQEQMQKLQQEHMQMQMQQQKEMMARQQQEQALAGQFARPGMPERPQMGPTPDGSPMPMAPAQAPGFDYQGYAGALAGVDPMKSLALQSQLAGMGQKESFTLKPGERRYQGDKVVAEGGPESVKPGTLKEVKSGGNIITYEWSGSKWEKIATAPQFKPDEAKPGQYDAERGLLIDPRTGEAKPVMQGGQPIGQKPNKPNSEYQKNITGITNLQSAVDEYVKELPKFGVTDMANPAARAHIGTKYNNMMLQAKEAYNLGVLNGPDYQILQQIVTNPLTMKGAITPNTAMVGQAEELKRIMEGVKANAARVHGQPVPEKPQAAQPKAPVRTGTHNGKKVIQYSDGSIEYAN